MKLVIVAGLALTTSLLAIDNEPAHRLGEAASVFSGDHGSTRQGDSAGSAGEGHCIVIVPSVKTAAFIVGAKYGKGYLVCRSRTGHGWSAPAAVRIEGGSFGFQIGARKPT